MRPTVVGLVVGVGGVEGVVGCQGLAFGGLGRHADLGVETVPVDRRGAVDVEVPVAYEVLLVEHGAVGAQERRFAVVVTHVEYLLKPF